MAANDIRDLDRRAVQGSVAVVAGITAGDLGRPTPCADWTLAELLAHMTAQHHGFAATARGGGADLAQWAVRPAGDDPVAEYAAAADLVIAAFAEPGVLDRKFALPEISRSLTFPAAQAIGFHLVDYVVHGWDVARALGVEYAPEPDVVAAALPVAEAVPDGGRRLVPGAAFRPRLVVPGRAAPLDQVLALLGRPPTWPAGATG